jgi:hypothetical protein
MSASSPIIPDCRCGFNHYELGGKIIYSTPGSGKAFMANRCRMYNEFISNSSQQFIQDADDFTSEYLLRNVPDLQPGTARQVIQSFARKYSKRPAETKKSYILIARGMAKYLKSYPQCTIVTGSWRFINCCDVVCMQTDRSLWRSSFGTEYDPTKEYEEAQKCKEADRGCGGTFRGYLADLQCMRDMPETVSFKAIHVR